MKDDSKPLASILFFFFIFGFSGCNFLQEKTLQEPSLQEAQTIYQNVHALQKNPSHNLVRTDLPIWYESLAKGSYLYTVPYFPYFLYNSFLTYVKEGFLLPAELVIGGSEWQDKIDKKLENHTLQYKEEFEKIWDKKDEANFVNMDYDVIQDFQSSLKTQ